MEKCQHKQFLQVNDMNWFIPVVESYIKCALRNSFTRSVSIVADNFDEWTGGNDCEIGF